MIECGHISRQTVGIQSRKLRPDNVIFYFRLANREAIVLVLRMEKQFCPKQLALFFISSPEE